MYQHPGGLVYHDEVIILINDIKRAQSQLRVTWLFRADRLKPIRNSFTIPVNFRADHFMAS